MTIKHEFLDSLIDNGFEKWYDNNGYLIRDGANRFTYDLNGNMLTQSWTELADTREVYEVLFEIRYEYSKMKDSSYKYKIGTISFDESSQAFNEGREPNFINDSELLHIREEIYDENRRLKLIKQFDIKNSTVEETTFNFQDDVFQSYRTLLNGTLIEEKAHYYTDNNLQKITQCFSPLDKL